LFLGVLLHCVYEFIIKKYLRYAKYFENVKRKRLKNSGQQQTQNLFFETIKCSGVRIVNILYKLQRENSIA